MPKISLWKGQKSNNYRYADKVTSQYMYAGGAGILVHKYLGVGTGEDITEIQDVLFLENRNRNYSEEVIELRGTFSPVDTDYDLSQFGIFLSSDTLRFDFHYNDMIQLIGRKLIPGDVLEVPAERDANLSGVMVNSYYVVEDALYSSSGYSVTWHPHIWKVRTKKLDGSPEFSSIVESAAKRSTMGNEGEFTGIMPEGISDMINGEMYDATAKEAVNNYLTRLGINDQIEKEAEDNVFFDPKYFNGQHLYVYMGEDGYPSLAKWRTGDGVPPNGDVLRGIGTQFPDDMADGEYFLRVDMTPDRLYQKQGSTFKRIEDDLRKRWTSYNDRLETFIDNNNITTFEDGYQTTEKTSLHAGSDARVDLNKQTKASITKESEERGFIANKIGNVGSSDRKWKGTVQDNEVCGGLSITSVNVLLPDTVIEIPPLMEWKVIITSSGRIDSGNITINGYTNSYQPSNIKFVDGELSHEFLITLPEQFNDYRDTINVSGEVLQGNQSISLGSNDFDHYINGYKLQIDDIDISYQNSEMAANMDDNSIISFNYGGSHQSLLGASPIIDVSSDTINVNDINVDDASYKVDLEFTGKPNLFIKSDNSTNVIGHSPINMYQTIQNIDNVNVATLEPIIKNDAVVSVPVESQSDIEISFNQELTVTGASIITPSSGSINSSFPMVNVSDININVDSTGAHIDDQHRTIEIYVTTLSGMTFTLQKEFILSGSKSSSIVFEYPSFKEKVEFISSPADIISITATINSSPPLTLTMSMVDDQYLISGPEEYAVVEENGELYIIIDENTLPSFYYDDNNTITMEISHR